MKKTLITLLFAGSMVGFVSCSNNQNSEAASEPGTTASAEDHNDAKFNNDGEKDAQFVVDAANLNLMEVKLSEMAEARATHPEIKEMAKSIIAFHNKSNEQLTSIAKNKNITVPVTPSAEEVNLSVIQDKNGVEFDKAYYGQLVEIHKETIERFEKAANDCQDADLRNYAATQLPTLRSHLDKAMDNQKLAENW